MLFTLWFVFFMWELNKRDLFYRFSKYEIPSYLKWVYVDAKFHWSHIDRWSLIANWIGKKNIVPQMFPRVLKQAIIFNIALIYGQINLRILYYKNTGSHNKMSKIKSGMKTNTQRKTDLSSKFNCQKISLHLALCICCWYFLS